MTTHRQLVFLPGGGLVLDTPGMRELQLVDDEGLGLSSWTSKRSRTGVVFATVVMSSSLAAR